MARENDRGKGISTKEIRLYGNTTVESGAFAHLGDDVLNVQIVGGHHVHYHHAECSSQIGTSNPVGGIQSATSCR